MAKATSPIPVRPPTIRAGTWTVNDDFDHGFAIGDELVDTVAEKSYTCVKNLPNGSAVWEGASAISAHDLGGAFHTADTLANLNTKVSDATLDDSGDPRDPNAHAGSHSQGASDEVTLENLDTAEVAGQIPVSLVAGTIQMAKYYLVTPADDLAAIVNASSGGELYWLTEGTHTLSGAISISAINSVSIKGPREAIVVATGLGAVDMFTMDNCDDIALEGFRISATLNAGQNVIAIGNSDVSDRMRVRNLFCVISTNNANFIYKNGANGMSDCVIECNHVTGEILSGVTIIASTGTAERNTVSGNSLISSYASSGTGIELEGVDAGNTNKYSRIEQNYIESFDTGIVSEHASHIHVVGNTINTTRTGHGIMLDDCSDSVCSSNILIDITTTVNYLCLQILNSPRCVISNNHTDGGYNSIRMTGSLNCVVSGNYFANCVDEGFEMFSGDGTTIEGNVFLNSGWFGIDCDSDHIAITGNVFWATVHASIQIDNTASHCTITGNTFYSSGDEAIDILGDDCVVADNVIDGQGVTTVGIKFNTCDRLTVNGNRIHNVTDDGIEVDSGSTLAQIHGNRIYNVGAAGIDNDSANAQISDNYIAATTSYGIDNDGDGCDISGNKLTACGDTAIRCTGVTGTHVNDNDIDHAHASNAIAFTGTNTRSSCNGNKIEGNDTATAGITFTSGTWSMVQNNQIANINGPGIDATTMSDSKLNDNLIHDVVGDGIEIDDSARITMSDNTVEDATVDGYDLNNVDASTISDNRASTCGGYGMTEDASSDANNYVGNYLEGTTGNWLMAGTNRQSTANIV